MSRTIKDALPLPAYNLLRLLKNFGDHFHAASFIARPAGSTGIMERLRLVAKIYTSQLALDCPHTVSEMLEVIEAILCSEAGDEAVVVEAGCFKGGSTSKLSLAASLVGRRLVVFDSFEGMPENDEPHDRNIFGGEASFQKGDYCGTLEEVRFNVRKYGDIGVCEFRKGWFDDTMPHFTGSIAVAYIDVDLASSTRTCLKYLYPRLVGNGVLFSQDGHLPLVLDVFDDEGLWSSEIGVEKPGIAGFRKEKLIHVRQQVTPTSNLALGARA